ncbi:MAG: hypothetical protein HZC15_00560 [Candidatus Omnitrophica bacterium]|nr:hypothetical protein [Candidatus Omnitrophota bacterium]
MKPTYEELTELNPGLKSRPRKEVDKLVEAIISRGYVWDDKKKYFYNKQIGMHIRTQGLDLFDPEGFERAYKTWSNPEYAKGASLGQRYIPKLIVLFIFDLVFGWIFIPVKIWVVTLLTIPIVAVVIRKFARKKMGLS